MNHRTQARKCDCRREQGRLGRIVPTWILQAVLFVLNAWVLVPIAMAANGTLQLSVVSARTEPRAFGGAGVVKGAAVSQYKYIINLDNTGTTTQRTPADGCNPAYPGYPGSCNWVSVAGAAPNSPIFTQGTQADIATVSLPPGRYLISVLGPGYKLDGQHFTIPAAGGVVPVTVNLQPTPLPAATIQAAVFEDVSPVNGAPDVPAEHGLAGFQGHVAEYLGEVTTDVFGNPLCTEYEKDTNGNVILNPPDYSPTPIPGTGGKCLSKCYDSNDAVVPLTGSQIMGSLLDGTPWGRCPDVSPAGLPVQGKVIVPNMGPNRYAFSVVPPDGSNWAQTTTLEGNLDFDAWVMEGATGLDTEFVVAGEPFPAIIFGYVPVPSAAQQSWRDPAFPLGGGSITGVIDAVKVYIPPKGGLGLGGTIWGGAMGAKVDKPVESPWVTLTDLSRGDTMVWAGRGGANGSFTIPSVPAGNYTLTWFDKDLNYILDLLNVTVGNNETVDMGILPLTGWWTKIEGYVFTDTNGNGKRDPGEPGLANYPVALKRRENTVMDRGAVGVTTDQTGYYVMENAYPMTQWLVVEAYDDLHYGTGVTYQADNQPTETTVLGDGVDVGVLPIIGLSGRLDWGKRTYASGTNGGIVGTVTYDTTRNELDPRFAATEPWQPGISGMTVKLWAPVFCGTNTGTPCDAGERYELAADGSFAKGQLLNVAVTETWVRPTGCVARNVDGFPLAYPGDQQVLPIAGDAQCLEGPLQGVQFETGFSAVNGNYGFVDGCFGLGGFNPLANGGQGACADGSDPTALASGDYLVEVVSSNDSRGLPSYKVTREEDINIFSGDQYVPQIPPPECAGKLHTVDVAGVGIDGYPSQTTATGITVPVSTPTDNPDFADGSGTPFEGSAKPLCDMKLIRVSNGRSIAPNFNFFTDVPLPGRFWGLIVDDLNFSTDPKSLLYGEKAGIPFAPVGIYDFTNRLVTTVESDYNGLFDVLLPSTNRISCPTPSGVCSNLYRFVGNDPGTPGKLNLNYNPQFRTISAEFEAFPGMLIPADLAPTQVGVVVQLPGGQVNQAVSCAVNIYGTGPDATPVNKRTPELFAVNRPFVPAGSNNSITITGQGFGNATGTLSLDNVVLPGSAILSWTDTSIVFSVPTSIAGGARQLGITASNGQSAVNGLTIHVFRGTYNPRRLVVGSGPLPSGATTYGTIQAALDAAASGSQTQGVLVIVYPGVPDTVNPRGNPRGAYYENLIIHSRLKLQGVGPGGIQAATGTVVRGTIVDGGAFGGDTALADAWRTRIAGLTWDGNQNVYEGAVIYVLAQDGQFANCNPQNVCTQPGFTAAIDGLDLRGGDQQGFPTNINVIGGGATGLPANAETQGGAIFANGYARYLQITNNVIQNNGGAYGTVRIGTPDLPAPGTSNHNENLRIASNRIIANGGTNLAGGIGIFAGTDNYEVAQNDICGNFSAEYGGGLSVYGYSPNGKIHHNRIYFNRSYDEGGGVMIAGQLPANPATLSPGSGPVEVYSNVIQGNLANDDGGGLRFLMAGNFPLSVYNNMIVNNVSTHEGGGIGLNDAPDVRIYNNTIMKNITTATAVTSSGFPAPAGLSTSANSFQLQNQLVATASPLAAYVFSNPMLFNNIFWDNRAGTRAGATVIGLGLTGDANPINNWDLGVADGSGLLSPTNSILQVTTGTLPSPSNLVTNPLVVSPYNVSVAFAPWRTNPNFVDAILVAVDLPPSQMGDYHIATGSPALNTGAANKTANTFTVNAPSTDFDNQNRPSGPGFDIGADEFSATPNPASANLSITKTDGQTTVAVGTSLQYTIVVTNGSASAVSGAIVTDSVPAALTGVLWSCTPASGSSCAAANGSGSINTTVNLAGNGSVTFSVIGVVSASLHGGTLLNTATVATPPGTIDPVPGNNTATDTDQVLAPLPALGLLDDFQRANANTLGGNWSQATLLGNASIRVDNNQAYALLLGTAIWNVPASEFGASQGAAFTFSSTPATGAVLMLKVSGTVSVLGSPQNYIRVSFQTNSGGQVVIATTTNGNAFIPTFTARGTFAAPFVAGDTLSAVAYSDGIVNVYRTSGSTTTQVGTVVIPTSGTGAWTPGTGGGRIGIQLPTSARVDDFKGATIP